jgi:FixJ family two-component response regulator
MVPRMLHGVPPIAPVVTVVDDDESVRESLPALLGVLGYGTHAFSSAEEFLAAGGIADTDCLILDVVLPGLSGPELQRELIRQGHAPPTIFITALSEQSLPPDLLEQGAVHCLFKPFSEQDLRDALDAALVR